MENKVSTADAIAKALRTYLTACDVAASANVAKRDAVDLVTISEEARQQAWRELKRLNPERGIYLVEERVLEIDYRDYPYPQPLVTVIG